MDKKTKSPLRLSAAYDFAAAHRLYRPEWDDAKNAAVFGRCARLHGHEFRLEISVVGEVQEDTGMIMNLYDMEKVVKEKILARVDHYYLNESIPFFKEHLPTAEWISVWVYNELRDAFPAGVRLSRVRVYETPALYAEYVPGE